MSTGTKELLELVDFAIDGIEVALDAQADGKFSWDDLLKPKFIKLLTEVPAAFGGIEEIPAEIADLDEAQATELVTHIMAKLAVDDAKARSVIAASLKLLVSGYELYKAVRA